jgi:hypothetical protein
MYRDGHYKRRKENFMREELEDWVDPGKKDRRLRLNGKHKRYTEPVIEEIKGNIDWEAVRKDIMGE